MSIADEFNGVCENLDSSCKLDVEKNISDEELFKQPPPKEDCPICFQQLPLLKTGYRYMTCCGKMICCGCAYAPLYDDQGNEVDNEKCPFCRIPTPYTEEEAIEREKKRLEADDPLAIHNLGCDYRDGRFGYTQDYTKAFQLWHRAAELGHATAYGSIGTAYYLGTGVEVDKKKAIHYYKLSAIEGNVTARYNLGNKEYAAGKFDRALKHFMIAVRGGSNSSLKQIKQLYLDGHATKEDYTKALRLYQEYLGEIKSVQRDKAAAFNSEKYRYY